MTLGRIFRMGVLIGTVISCNEGNDTSPDTGGDTTTDSDSSSGKPSGECDVDAVMPSADELTEDLNLPDPFVKLDGNRITDKSEWGCRRQEILRLGYEFIYGEMPETPSEVSGTVSESSITVSVTEGESTSFNASVEMPSAGDTPYPAVIGFGGGFFGLNGDLKSILSSQGVAVINFDPYQVGEENGGGPGTQGSGGFYDVYGADHPAGLLTAWAWGVSRLIDVIEEDGELFDATRIGVAGCSRFGKAAFIAGAFDTRVALTVPIESGIGGTPALRLVPRIDNYSGSEQPKHAVSYQPWLSPSLFYQFVALKDGTPRLPIDTHEIMGLVAPRGLLILDNPSRDYPGLDINSAYVAAVAGSRIFEALGVSDNITYQGASGGHCAWRSRYTDPLIANIEKFLLGDTSAATGTFETDREEVDAEDYIEWTVPELTGELDSAYENNR